MRASIPEWLWRVALLGALALIGWELQRIHEDLLLPPDDAANLTAGNSDTLDSLDDIRDDLNDLTRKVDAIMIVMARAK